MGRTRYWGPLETIFLPLMLQLYWLGRGGGLRGPRCKPPPPPTANRQRPRIPRLSEGSEHTYHLPLILLNKYTPQPTGETLQTFRYVKHECAPLGAFFEGGGKLDSRREVQAPSTRIYAKRGSYWTRGEFPENELFRGFILVRFLLLANNNVLKTTPPTPPPTTPDSCSRVDVFCIIMFLYK